MEDDYTYQTPQKKSGVNMKNIAIIGVILGAVIVGALFYTSGFGSSGGLSGRYVSEYDRSSYIEFSSGNKVKVYAGGITMQGTYTLNGNDLTMDLTVTVWGVTERGTEYARVSDDKRTITAGYETFTKR